MRKFKATVLMICITGLAVSQSGGVVSSSDRLPPTEGAYHGSSSHIFLDGQAVLTCSSHGTFQSSESPPKKKGESKDIAYGARFLGDITLRPPLVDRTTVIPIDQPIRMVERITNTGRNRGDRIFDTELISMSLSGGALPAGIIIRESTSKETLGRTRIERLPKRQFRIHTSYQVWMELSLDGGRTWHQQDRPVSMMLMPNHVR